MGNPHKDVKKPLGPVRNLVIYHVKKGSEKEFEKLFARHAPVLMKTGLATAEGVQAWMAKNIRTGEDVYVEMFTWRDADAPEMAHQVPEMMQVWEPMTPLLETMQILNLEPYKY